MIDAYDVLGISLDAAEEDIKKAYRRLSLLHHPDKVQASGSNCQDAGEKFNEIKLARDILQDVDRRKIYDTFGIDLGEERPEMEVWTIGLSTLLSPMCYFALKTLIVRAALWFIAFRWVGRILMLAGLASVGLYAADFSFRDVKVRSPDVISLLINLGILDAVVLVFWIWPLFADAGGVFYLASEVVGPALFLESWKIGVIAALVSLVVAWLARGWWFWILGLEVLLGVVLLVALTVAAGMMRLWIDGVQAQRSEKLREWRQALRKSRRTLEDEVADLKKKLQERDSEPAKRPAR